jgi:hypothetical protein
MELLNLPIRKKMSIFARNKFLKFVLCHHLLQIKL